MSYILDYKKWKSIFEQATTTTPAKPAAVPATPAGPPIGTIPATPDEIKKALTSQATHSISGQNAAGKMPALTSLLETIPSFPEAISARYGLKTMYDYWSKCGQLLIGARNPATVPSIRGLHIIFDTSDNLIVKKEDEFENWINGLNLEKWKTGKSTYNLIPKANTIFCRIGLSKPMPDVTEYKKYDVLVNGKTAARYAYIFMGSGNDRKSLSEFGEAGKTIETAIATEFLLIGESAERPANYFSVAIEIPKLSEYGAAQGTVEKDVFLSYTKGKDIVQIKKITADETKTEDGEKKPFSIDKKWDNLAFEVDKAELTSAHTTAIDDLVKQVKDTVTKDDIKGITVDELRIISSASNYYGGKVKPTHNNDGSENSEYGKYSGTDDPAPGKDHTTLGTGAEKNNKLAWSRGEAFSRVLMEKLNSDEELIKLGIKFGEPKIEWRITDTGGLIDSKRVTGEYPNPGQYVQVKMGVNAYTQKKEVIELPGKKGRIFRNEYIPAAVRFAPAPTTAGLSAQTTTIDWQKLQTK